MDFAGNAVFTSLASFADAKLLDFSPQVVHSILFICNAMLAIASASVTSTCIYRSADLACTWYYCVMLCNRYIIIL